MKLKTKLNTILFALVITVANAQMKDYHYKRELTGITNTWHRLILPDDLYKNVSLNLSDIRVFGITANQDTIEAPYIMQIKCDETHNSSVNFKLLNTSKTEKGFYFTLEVPTQEAINKLHLEFKQANFDWRVSLEGSQNQHDWFTIVDDYRILSIKNAETFYQYTDITFPSSKYQFFRLFIKSDEKPNLKDAKAYLNTVIGGVYNNYAIKNLATLENPQEKRSELNVTLYNKVPASSIHIHVNRDFDYYRPFTLQYLSDSIHTEKGWKYNYKDLTQETLSSFGDNNYTFKSTILKNIKIVIDNQDNEPLRIDSVSVKGCVHELAIRFTEPATYYLTYGNPAAHKPRYEIERFTSKIPDTVSALRLGDEQIIEKDPFPVNKPLFENKLWLWSLLITIIIILGWFSIKMIKSK
jgi:hypothetical protein